MPSRRGNTWVDCKVDEKDAAFALRYHYLGEWTKVEDLALHLRVPPLNVEALLLDDNFNSRVETRFVSIRTTTSSSTHRLMRATYGYFKGTRDVMFDHRRGSFVVDRRLSQDLMRIQRNMYD